MAELCGSLQQLCLIQSRESRHARLKVRYWVWQQVVVTGLVYFTLKNEEMNM